MQPSSIVELNRAMAIAMAYGPAEAAVEFRRAAGLTRNTRDREVLLARAYASSAPEETGGV